MPSAMVGTSSANLETYADIGYRVLICVLPETRLEVKGQLHFARVAAAHRQYKHELVPLRSNTVVRFDSRKK